MAEKEKKKQQDVEPKEEPKEEPTEEKTEEPKEQPKEEPKEQPKEDFAKMIQQLKDTQAKEMERLTKSFEDKIAERDKIIQDLIIGNDNKKTNEGSDDVAEIINKTRNYKKW